MLSRMGCECLDLGIIPDDPRPCAPPSCRPTARPMPLITTGASRWEKRTSPSNCSEELGEIGFWKLAIKPGKPFAFGRLPNAWFFGLPGNPVSAMVTFDQLVQPALARLAGQQFARPHPPRPWRQSRSRRARGAWTFSAAS